MVLQWYIGFRVSQHSEYLFGGTPIKRVLGFYVGSPTLGKIATCRHGSYLKCLVVTEVPMPELQFLWRKVQEPSI